jgi:glutamate/tyrosine decarboxylase-like PLP-dependent enzyme
VQSHALLTAAADHAAAYLDGLPERRVGPAETDPAALRAALGGPLPEAPSEPRAVVDALVAGAGPGLMASQSPRFFGFVFGGALPAALAADWLASAWDQNAVLYVAAPAAAVAEEVVGGWLAELLGVPATASFAITTGCQMAHATGLAAARHHVLARAGWDVEARGLTGAPPIRLLANADLHVTVLRAVRLLGLGTDSIVRLDTDAQGSMLPAALRDALAAADGPAIVCAQAGEVNSGAFDPLDEVCDAAAEHGAWVHVDGAFGLWAAASPALSHLAAGAGDADSWATDGHKWLNVPYDCGVVAVRDRAAHTAAMGMTASYLVRSGDADRSNSDWVPEASRRARGFAVYAALRSLGREGVAELVDRCCALARRLAAGMESADGVEVLNEVALNQVLLRFGANDALTDEVIGRVQEDGTCWVGGTRWRGQAAMRVSVSNWSTTEADIDRSADAILAAARRVSPEASPGRSS